MTKNSYNPAQWWGTITFTNNGPSPASNFVVEFDVPANKHCTADEDAVPPGWTLSPLVGIGLDAKTQTNHCVFTWVGGTALASGSSKTLEFSTDSNASTFTSVSNLVVSDTMCNAGSACNTFAVTKNSYSGSQWWGTITIKNNGPFTSSAFAVAIDLPDGAHCTAEPDAVPQGATLTPLVPGDTPNEPQRTPSSHCVFTWSNGPPIEAGKSYTFNYSADSQNFSSASKVLISDLMCAGPGNGGGPPGGSTGDGRILETGTDVGTLPGGFSVTPAGAATYAIPLWTPEGRNGMSPRLTLFYSSANGDGPFGLGWTVAGGTSVISRCVANSQNDARPAPITKVSTTLCLDGQRLALVSGTDGAVNSEYRTVPDSFTKIVLTDVDPLGPKQFKAYSRDGLIHTFGSPTNAHEPTLEIKAQVTQWLVQDPLSRLDSTIQPDPTAGLTRQAWLRGTAADRHGNTIWYRYTNAAGTSGPQEPLLQKIEYVDVGTNGSNKTRAVVFTYVPRQVVTTSQRNYSIAGVTFSNTLLLRSIDMQVAPPNTTTPETVRSYQLNHSNSGLTVRPRLDSVEVCDGKPGSGRVRPVWCQRATSFTYESAPPSFSSVVLQGLEDTRQGADKALWGFHIADLNRDGKGDVIYRARPPGAMPSDPPHWYVRFSKGTGSTTFDPPQDLGLQVNSVEGDPIVGDFDIDGFPDIGVPAAAGAYAYYQNQKTPTPFITTPFATETPGTAPSMGFVIADFSGRGERSILRPAASSPGSWSYSHLRTKCDPNGEFCHLDDIPTFSAPLPIKVDQNSLAGWNTLALDFDGDRALDLFGVGSEANRLSVLTQVKVPGADPLDPSDWTAEAKTTLLAGKQGDVVRYLALDQNGDGLTDLLRLHRGESVPRLIMNSGNGFAPPVPLNSLATDLGGKGNVELGPTTAANDIKDPGVRVLDYDGDGKDDILLVDSGAVRDSGAATIVPKRQQMVVLLSRGTGFEVQALDGTGGRPKIDVGAEADGFTPPGVTSLHNYKQTQIIDANGDGLSDILTVGADGKPQLWTRDGNTPDLLLGVEDGMGKKTGVVYGSMSDPNVYTRGNTCERPQICRAAGDRLVRQHNIENGRGGERQVYLYSYQDQRYDAYLDTVLGFTSWTIRDLLNHTKVTDKYNIDTSTLFRVHSNSNPIKCKLNNLVGCIYSFLGSPVEHRVEPVPGPNTTRTTTQVTTYGYELVGTNGARSYYTRVRDGSSSLLTSGITTQTWDTTAAVNPVATVLSVPTYDPGYTDFGLVAGETVKVTTPQGDFIDVSNVRYENYPSGTAVSPTPWLIGVRTEEVQCSTIPTDPVKATATNCTRSNPAGIATRVRTFIPDLRTGLPASMEVQPDGTPDEHLHVEYTREPTNGLLTGVKRVDRSGKSRADSTTYDSRRIFPATATNAVGHTSNTVFDQSLGVLLSNTDPNGSATSYDYDGFGRPRRMNAPGGGGETLSYGRLFEEGSAAADRRYAMLSTSTMDGGGEVRLYRNRLGQDIRREVKNFDGSFAFDRIAYDHRGLVESQTRAALVGGADGPKATRKFDDLGRLTQVAQPEEAVDGLGGTFSTALTSTVFLGMDQLTVDEVGDSTKTTSDPLGRVTRLERFNDAGQPVPTEYVYGPFGVLKKITRKAGNAVAGSQRTTDFGYDVLGRRTTLSDSNLGESGLRTLKYNAFGDVREEVDAAGSTVTYDLDNLGRATKRTDKDGVTMFVWDSALNGKGRLAESTSFLGVKRKYFYDGSGRVFRESWVVDGSTFDVDYAYDSQTGKLLHVSYPATPGFERLRLTNDYDPKSGRLMRITNNATGDPYWTLTATSVDGQIKAEVFGLTILTTNYDHSPRTGRLRSLSTVKTGITNPLRAWEYAYFRDGELQRRSDVRPGVDQHERFVYDALKRIKQWEHSWADGKALNAPWRVQYGYDDFGNMNQRTFAPGMATGGTAQSLAFDIDSARDRVTGSPWGGFGYDANGNQTSRFTGTPQAQTVGYTALDQPKSISGSQPATFKYDADGVQVQKVSGAETTTYAGALYEKRVTGTGSSATVDHVFYINGPLGVVAQVMRREGGSESTTYLHSDGEGSIDAVTTSSGGVAQFTKRDPYGNAVTNFFEPRLPDALVPNGNGVRLGFFGQEEHDDLGLVAMGGGLFDTRLATLLTPPPVVSVPVSAGNYDAYGENPVSMKVNNLGPWVRFTGAPRKRRPQPWRLQDDQGINKHTRSPLFLQDPHAPPPRRWHAPYISYEQRFRDLHARHEHAKKAAMTGDSTGGSAPTGGGTSMGATTGNSVTGAESNRSQNPIIAGGGGWGLAGLASSVWFAITYLPSYPYGQAAAADVVKGGINPAELLLLIKALQESGVVRYAPPIAAFLGLFYVGYELGQMKESASTGDEPIDGVREATAGVGGATGSAEEISEPADSGGETAINGETAATAEGRKRHKEWDPGEGFDKEVRLENRTQADAVNWERGEVIELKPNNPRAVQRGEKKVEEYAKQLDKQAPLSKGRKWKGWVETYEAR